MRTSIKYSLLAILSVSCQQSDKDTSLPPSSPLPLDDGNSSLPQGNDTQCQLGELKNDKGECFVSCTTDEDGKEWCLRANEQPSDTDPTKVLPICKHGFLNQDSCEKTMSVVADETSVRLYAGDTLRIEGNKDFINLVDLKLETNNGMGYPLVYDYETNYDYYRLSSFDTLDSDIHIKRRDSLEEISFFQRSNVYSIKNGLPAANPVNFDYYGVTFTTSPITLEEWEGICLEVAALSFNEDTRLKGFYDLEDTAEKIRKSCFVGLFSIQVVCNGKAQNCSLREVDLEWISNE